MSKFSPSAFGTSAEVKTPDGSTHTIPGTTEGIQQQQKELGASVGCSGLVKYSMNTKDPRTGNFVGVHLQISAWATLPCSPESKDIAYKEAERFVTEKIIQSRSEYIQKFDLQQWFQ